MINFLKRKKRKPSETQFLLTSSGLKRADKAVKIISKKLKKGEKLSPEERLFFEKNYNLFKGFDLVLLSETNSKSVESETRKIKKEDKTVSSEKRESSALDEFLIKGNLSEQHKITKRSLKQKVYEDLEQMRSELIEEVDLMYSLLNHVPEKQRKKLVKDIKEKEKQLKIINKRLLKQRR